jgi:hypothetical protein
MRQNTNVADMFRQVGALILKGAKPPDLPTNISCVDPRFVLVIGRPANGPWEVLRIVPIMQMLAAHLKLLKEWQPITEATPGSCGIAGIEPSPDCDILLNLRGAEFANCAVAQYERSGSSMTRQDHLGILRGATAKGGDLRILVQRRCVSAAMPCERP